MSREINHLYEFGPFRLDAAERLLSRAGEAVALTPKAFDLLFVLVARHGRLLEKEELLKLVWPGMFVEEANLSYNISLIRKALGDGENELKFIETVPKRGYRFVASVKEVEPERAKPGDVSQPELSGGEFAPTPAVVSAEIPNHRSKLRKPGVMLALTTLVVVGAGLAYWITQRIVQQNPIAPTQAMKITRLTHNGKAMRAAISPDGKYVAYVLEEAGRQSLWLRHVATNSDTQVSEPAEANYRGVAFSPDGDFIYYVRGKPRDPVGENFDASGALYKTTILGKGEKKLIEKAHHSLTFSPDGKQVAFVRQLQSEGKSLLIVANADGSDERPLFARTSTHPFSNDGGLAWSPDGKLIACVVRNMTPSLYRSVVGVRIADGVEIPLTAHKWQGVMRDLEWLPDGSGLLILGEERVGSSHQIWRLSYPGDKLQKLTDDLNDYLDISLAATAGMLATVRSDRLVNIWVAPNGDVSRARQITFGAGRQDGLGGLAWTPDGKIVYVSNAGGAPHIWLMEADGTGNKQLSTNDIMNINSTVSPDGKHIVWIASPKGVRNIWQMDIDGGNPKQLSHGAGEWNPKYSPDGKWLIYAGLGNSLWKMPLAGGAAAVQLTSGRSWLPTISPDGRLIAFNLLDEAVGQWKIAVMPFAGGPPNKVFGFLGGNFRRINWTPNGQELAFTIYRNGVSNIWAQPLEGGLPRQLTDFRDGLLFDFAWSQDGKQLALSRGLINSDVVLIKHFR